MIFSVAFAKLTAEVQPRKHNSTELACSVFWASVGRNGSKWIGGRGLR